MKKAKAEQFIDYVQNALILGGRGKHPELAMTMVRSLFHELERASRAALYIPETLAAEEAARDFVRFISEPEGTQHALDAPAWLRQFVSAEREPGNTATHAQG